MNSLLKQTLPVAGAAEGANVRRVRAVSRTLDVQRSTTFPSQNKPEFWDVTSPLGRTVTVNRQGEPRA
ncbi:MAG: hypothetical protein H7Y33_11460 [Cytophagales bacterium]|nr:hypothetical protein [Rhizobacter sp.]